MDESFETLVTPKDKEKDEYIQFYNEISRKYGELIKLKDEVKTVIEALKEQQGYDQISSIKKALEDALNEMEVSSFTLLFNCNKKRNMLELIGKHF